jgi:hypothetical protein
MIQPMSRFGCGLKSAMGRATLGEFVQVTLYLPQRLVSLTGRFMGRLCNIIGIIPTGDRQHLPTRAAPLFDAVEAQLLLPGAPTIPASYLPID